MTFRQDYLLQLVLLRLDEEGETKDSFKEEKKTKQEEYFESLIVKE
jgi:hypothetical protein